MIRTTTRIKLAVMVLIGLMLAGCSPEYGHKTVGPDSPEGRTVTAMLQELRRGGKAGVDHFIDRHGASSLTLQQRRGLRAALEYLATTTGALKLVELDRFGPRVFRAGVRVSGPPAVTAALLLVESGGELRWAGPN